MQETNFDNTIVDPSYEDPNIDIDDEEEQRYQEMLKETKKVYSYNPHDKIYIGEILLTFNDRSPSFRWNIPAFCTETEPLEEKEGFDIIYNKENDNWEYKEKEVQNENSLEYLKEKKIYELKYQRNELENSPIEYNGNLIDYDTVSQQRMFLVNQLLENQDTNEINWTNAENNQTSFTTEDFKQINIIAAKRTIELHTKYNEAKKLVQSATSEEELNNINISL